MKTQITTLAAAVLGLTVLGQFGLAAVIGVTGLVLARLIRQEPKRLAARERMLRTELAE
jgi:nitrate reductase gamma subunit